jgi:eukaryotic-like serine/threonine-protein kinase
MLEPGTRFGSYEVVSLLGAGGMGEVYRARDTKLRRDVALKVLPDVLRNDPERLARFEREARLLASLNHPNIATIHQIEEIGGISALVLELVEGPTLADRLTEGALQREEALGIARQIVSALEAAHEVGVVHRDLKPANIKLRPDGTVKVLDFGLAKALESRTDAAPNSDLPTRTSPAMTQIGRVLGTVAYMSPERLRGLPADQRADIWAFGCVLFEMLSGLRAFPGDHWSDISAGVLEREPDFARLPRGTPHSVRRLLQWCLEKDPRRRLHHIADARLDLDTESSTNSQRQTSEKPSPTRARSVVSTISGLLAGGLMVFMAMRLASPTMPGVVTFAFSPPPNVELRDPMALSPDGRTLVYTGTDDRGSRLYRRALDALDSVPIRGTEGGGFPFFSPDGAWVGFSDGRSIKKVPVQGGTAETVCEISGDLRATWLPDDTIVFGSTSGLMRVAASGGGVRQITIVDRAHGEIEHHSPVSVPGADAVLFTVYSGARDGQRIEVVSLDSGTRTPLVRGSGAQYAGTEHIVFAFEHSGSLWVAPFDRKRLTMTGPAAPVLEGILISDHWIPTIAVGPNGSLAYARGTAASQYSPRKLFWVDSTGREEPVDAPARPWWWPEISPDGKRLGVHMMDPANMDAWIYELDNGPLRRMTLHPAQDGYPLWSPDGNRIAFWSRQGGVASNLYLRSADLTGGEERLTSSPNAQAPFSWTRDGRLVFQEFSPETRTDIGLVPIEGARTPTLIIRGPSDEGRPSMSRDGRWIAYQANPSGRFEVYVQPFPELGDVHQISTEGGASPLWHPNGRELVYRQGRMMISVPITTTGASFKFGNPRTLFERSYVMEGSDVGGGRSYALAPDGRFLMMKEEEGVEGGSGPAEIVVILNWIEDLKRRLTGEEDRAR